MLWHGRWVLKCDIFEIDLLFQLDSHSYSRVRVILNFGLPLDHLENERSERLRSHQALYVWQGGYQANEPRDQGNQD